MPHHIIIMPCAPYRGGRRASSWFRPPVSHELGIGEKGPNSGFAPLWLTSRLLQSVADMVEKRPGSWSPRRVGAPH